jgi:acyl-CoA thioester hydrolase
MKHWLPIQIRWADIDANRHLRHSAYYDYAASARIEILSTNGLTLHKLEELAIGPVLLREEAVFRREIRFEDSIRISTEVLKSSPDYTRWTIRHEIEKADGVRAAVITIDGAWIDMHKRKFAAPDQFVVNIFDALPKSPEFQFIEIESLDKRK